MARVYNLRLNPPDDAVYIGRAGKGQAGEYGNYAPKAGNTPYPTAHDYELQVMSDPALREKLKRELYGKHLVCFCARKPEGLAIDDQLVCHGQVILRTIRGDYDENTGAG